MKTGNSICALRQKWVVNWQYWVLLIACAVLVGCQAEPVVEVTLAPTAATLLPPTPTATLVPTETPPPTATPDPGLTPTPITHTVQDGETMSDLAVRYGVSVTDISAANGLAGDVTYVG